MNILYSIQARKRIVKMEEGMDKKGRSGTWVTYASGKRKFKDTDRSLMEDEQKCWRKYCLC